jgi:hypothetical protein
VVVLVEQGEYVCGEFVIVTEVASGSCEAHALLELLSESAEPTREQGPNR